MDGYQIFLILLAGYIAFLIITGIYFTKRQKSLREFLLAGKRAGALSIGFSAAASWLTAGALLAVTGFFMLLGTGSIWGFVAPNILALIIISVLVRKIRSVPAMTQPELLEMRYGTSLRGPVALIIIVVMILFAVADIKGFGLVLQVFYGIGSVQAALIVGLSVAVYVTLGGLSAVIATDTIQFLCLSAFVLVMAALVLSGAADVSSVPVMELAGSNSGNWWNPLSVGLPMVLIFCLAILPGWITEQDPWQKVWAARSDRVARNGFLIGAVLVTLVFGGCALIALGLNTLYPEISKMGFPMGMAKAEPALLQFILDSNFPVIVTAICGVALAAAAMSCADTFAVSGGSCISRDLYQRYINPSATMGQMLAINRVSVLLIIGFATLGSFFIDSIIDAIHIATFIASASYFFALMGGMYWKRGTGPGASWSMIIGFFSQCALVGIDKFMTTAGAPPYLETIHPILMGHGVIAAMLLSGVTYVAVSLATAPSEAHMLAPFFPKSMQELATLTGPVTSSNEILPDNRFYFEKTRDDQVYLRLNLDIPADLAWEEFLTQVQVNNPQWIAFGNESSLRRCTRPDFLSCASLIRGDLQTVLWLEIEGTICSLQELKKELSDAFHDIHQSLASTHPN
ncbi:sodium:solute symporter [Desulfopila sp. IMCC35008]|uniref:sodium:solute symporter family protein n=1 Tax=Desulfopila sp. IMCC35008 TaxID=2653858 RepID=UPI0013D0282F|nr:sodium:solute symporter family protein [Desulfopila sp. IMCC35008]